MYICGWGKKTRQREPTNALACAERHRATTDSDLDLRTNCMLVDGETNKAEGTDECNRPVPNDVGTRPMTTWRQLTTKGMLDKKLNLRMISKVKSYLQQRVRIADKVYERRRRNTLEIKCTDS